MSAFIGAVVEGAMLGSSVSGGRSSMGPASRQAETPSLAWAA